MRLLLLALIFLIFICGAFARSCANIQLGRYCSDSCGFDWCYPGAVEAAHSSCPVNTKCLCAFVPESSNPCGIPGGALPPGCQGTVTQTECAIPEPPAQPPADTTNSSGPTLGVYNRKPSEHLPQVLAFDPNNFVAQLRQLVSSPSYNDASIYKPATTPANSSKCSFHPSKIYENTLNQIFIGRPTETTTISYSPGVTVRLPDRYIGLMLAYSLDMYGLNPSMMLALSTKESFFPAVFADSEDAKSYFLAGEGFESYSCYASSRKGLCRDQNKDGPFQVETPAMSTDVSVFAQRFYVGDLSVPKAERKPTFNDDNYFLLLPTFREFHDIWTLDNAKAVVLTSLDFHYRFNLLIRLKTMGMLPQYLARSSREEQEQLLFAAAMFTYNRGVFDKNGLNRILNNCSAGRDPILDCGLNGYGGHSYDIGQVCNILERSTEIYDFDVTKEDADWFVDKMEETFAYDAVEGFHESINWPKIRSAVNDAFQILQAARGGNGKISFRYDWRPIVAVVRAFLPEKEMLLGDTLKTLDTGFYDNSIQPDLAPLTGKTWPFTFVATAGSHGVSSTTQPNAPHAPGEVIVNGTTDGDLGLLQAGTQSLRLSELLAVFAATIFLVFYVSS